jgi:hypothetical protein
MAVGNLWEAGMSVHRNLLAVSSFAALAIATASSANAQSLPAEGNVSVTFTATQIPPPKPMPIGENKEYTLMNMAMTASNDEGNPILNNMGGHCLFNRTVDTSAKTTEQHGYCTYSDNDGNQIFEKCDFMPGGPNNCKFTGGTGKFAGLQADVTITAGPLKSNYDGIAQIIGHKKGTYKIVKTN